MQHLVKIGFCGLCSGKYDQCFFGFAPLFFQHQSHGGQLGGGIFKLFAQLLGDLTGYQTCGFFFAQKIFELYKIFTLLRNLGFIFCLCRFERCNIGIQRLTLCRFAPGVFSSAVNFASGAGQGQIQLFLLAEQFNLFRLKRGDLLI